MSDTLAYVLQKYNLPIGDMTRMPIEIPNMGRQQLAELFSELEFQRIVEIGVRNGGYSETLCQANPAAHIWGVDPYEPHRGYRDHVRKSTFQGFEKEAHDRLDKYPNYRFIRDYSANALAQFEDNSLDAVYIDGDHSFYEATHDIDKWSKKVRPGGIISGDDYYKHKGKSRIHVYQVINGYTEAWNIKPWFIVGSKAINPGEIRDHGRSWFYVNG